MKHLLKVNLYLLVGLMLTGMAFAAERIMVAEMITDET